MQPLNVQYQSQPPSTEMFVGMCFFWIIYLALVVAWVAGTWKVYAKAGQPGWAAIVPIYNMIIWCEIVGRPWWWVLLLCIPCVGFFAFIVLCLDLAKAYGKDVGYGVGLILVPFVFLPMLGFGASQYQGPVRATA